MNGFWLFWSAVLCLLIFFNIADYYYTVVDFRPWTVLLLALCIAAATLLAQHLVRRERLAAFLRRNPERILLGLVLGLFCIQTVFLAIAYVPIGWDVRDIVQTAAGERLFTLYFLRYPNNTLMTACFKFVYLFARKFGMDCWLSSLLLGALATDTALALGTLAVKKLFGLRAFYLSIWFSIFLFALHPTLSTPYSDTMSMPFVAGFFYCGVQFFQAKTRRKKSVYAFLCGITLLFGYYIKPTVLIAGIAAAIGLLLRFKKPNRQQIGSVLLCLLLFAGGGLSAYVGNEAAEGYIHQMLPTEQERDAVEFPLSHFLMMGLNEREDNYYGYFRGDVNTTALVSGKAEKTELHKTIIRARLTAFGVGGFLEHCLNKAIWVSTDGTFYYGGEGDFHDGNAKTEGGLRGFLQNYIYTETDAYRLFFANYMQAVWLVVQVGVVLSCLRKAHSLTPEQRFARFFLQLSLFGLTLFLMLFEARSRYLFLYLPYYCALAGIGFASGAPKRKKPRKSTVKSR